MDSKALRYALRSLWFGPLFGAVIALMACGSGGGGGAVVPTTPVAKSWKPAVLLESNNAGSGVIPQVAVDANGNALAVWLQSDGTRNYVWFNRYTLGAGWGTAGPIEPAKAGGAGSMDIAMDANGNLMAVWQEFDGTRANIWANRYGAGTGWGTAALIETDNAGTANSPQVAFDNLGNALVVWYQQDGQRTNVWSNRYSVGTGWGTAALIEATDEGDAFVPQIAFDASGNALAVWLQSDAIRTVTVWANRYSVGSGWGTATAISTNVTGNASNPQIAIDANGNAMAVWSRTGSVGFNRYTNGKGWGVAASIQPNSTQSGLAPQIAFDASGNALAVWHQSDAVASNIRSSRYTEGAGWGPASPIETDDTAEAYGSQIAIDASGNALAVWLQSDGTRENVLANRYTGGVGWGTAVLLETDNAGQALDPQVAFDANGNALAVWYQFDGARYNVWSARFE